MKSLPSVHFSSVMIQKMNMQSLEYVMSLIMEWRCHLLGLCKAGMQDRSVILPAI